MELNFFHRCYRSVRIANVITFSFQSLTTYSEKLIPTKISTNNARNREYHIQLNIPRNKIHSPKFHSDIALEVATTCSQKPSRHRSHLAKIMQEICGRVHVIYPHLSRTRVVTRGETLVSPLLWAVHDPSSAFKRRWKMISLHGTYVYYSTARAKSY